MSRKAEKYMGTPCKYQHDGLRYERTGSCVHCALLAAAKQKQAKKIKELESQSDEVAIHLQPQQ